MFELHNEVEVHRWAYDEEASPLDVQAVFNFLRHELCANPAAVASGAAPDEHGRDMRVATVPGTEVTVLYVVTTRGPYDHNGIHLVRVWGTGPA